MNVSRRDARTTLNLGIVLTVVSVIAWIVSPEVGTWPFYATVGVSSFAAVSLIVGITFTARK